MHLVTNTYLQQSFMVSLMEFKHDIQKNGSGVVIYVWAIDTSKPSVYLEGNSYKFNKTLMSTSYHKGKVEDFEIEIQ